MDTSVLIACLLSFMLGAAFMAVGLWFRDQTADAERWGRSLKDGPVRWAIDYDANDAAWQGLEDVRVRVRPIYDYDKEKKA